MNNSLIEYVSHKPDCLYWNQAGAHYCNCGLNTAIRQHEAQQPAEDVITKIVYKIINGTTFVGANSAQEEYEMAQEIAKAAIAAMNTMYGGSPATGGFDSHTPDHNMGDASARKDEERELEHRTLVNSPEVPSPATDTLIGLFQEAYQRKPIPGGLTDSYENGFLDAWHIAEEYLNQREITVGLSEALHRMFSKRNAGEILAYLEGVLDGKYPMPGALMAPKRETGCTSCGHVFDGHYESCKWHVSKQGQSEISGMGWFLPENKCSEMAARTFMDFLALVRHGAKLIDIHVRKDAKEYHFQADILKYMERIRLPMRESGTVNIEDIRKALYSFIAQAEHKTPDDFLDRLDAAANRIISLFSRHKKLLDEFLEQPDIAEKWEEFKRDNGQFGVGA